MGLDETVVCTFDTRSSYNCYKLLGLDILLDSQLQPWVLEVNSDPVLHPDSVDFPVKSKLIPEMFNILGLHIPQVKAGNHTHKIFVHRKSRRQILLSLENSFPA